MLPRLPIALAQVPTGDTSEKQIDTATSSGKDFLDNQIDKFNKEYITG